MIEMETPTEAELIYFFKSRWNWKGSSRMFKLAASEYQKSIADGSWVWENNILRRAE